MIIAMNMLITILIKTTIIILAIRTIITTKKTTIKNILAVLKRLKKPSVATLLIITKRKRTTKKKNVLKELSKFVLNVTKTNNAITFKNVIITKEMSINATVVATIDAIFVDYLDFGNQLKKVVA